MHFSNEAAKLHRDGGNERPSIAITIGSFTGNGHNVVDWPKLGKTQVERIKRCEDMVVVSIRIALHCEKFIYQLGRHCVSWGPFQRASKHMLYAWQTTLIHNPCLG